MLRVLWKSLWKYFQKYVKNENKFHKGIKGHWVWTFYDFVHFLKIFTKNENSYIIEYLVFWI